MVAVRGRVSGPGIRRVRLLRDEYKNALYYAGSDIGAKINAAVADLPTRGGTVYIPPGSYNFTTKIELKTAKAVELRGGTVHGGHSHNRNHATQLVRTGTASTTAIEIGNGTTELGGIALRDFELRYLGQSGIGVDVSGPWTAGQMENVRLYGDNRTNASTGIRLKNDSNNYSWRFYNCEWEYWGIGIDHPRAAHTQFHGCCIFYNDKGIVIGDDTYAPSSIFFFGCDIEQNYDVGIEAYRCSNLGWYGGYGECYTNVAASRIIRIGAHPNNHNVYNVKISNVNFSTGGGPSYADYPIDMKRVLGLTVEDSFFGPNFGKGGIGLITGTSVYYLRFVNNYNQTGNPLYVDSSGTEITTGLVEMCDHERIYLNPATGKSLILGNNIPTSDPSVTNAVWCDTTDSRRLKLSAGP